MLRASRTAQPSGCDTRRPSLEHATTSGERLPERWSLGRLGGFLFFSLLLKTKTEDAREPDSFPPQTDRPGTNRSPPRSVGPLRRRASLASPPDESPEDKPPRDQPPEDRPPTDQPPDQPHPRQTAASRRPAQGSPPQASGPSTEGPASPPPKERLARSLRDRASLVVGVGPCGPPLVTEFPTRIAFSSGDFAPETSRPERREFPERGDSPPSPLHFRRHQRLPHHVPRHAEQHAPEPTARERFASLTNRPRTTHRS